MAGVTDYSSLVQELTRFAARQGDADFADSVDTFIQFGGGWLNRKLPLRVMEADVTLVGTVGSRFVSLPSDYVEPFAMHVSTFGEPCALFPSIAGQTQVSSVNGTPERWAIDGANIAFDVPCDQAHTFIFRYRKSFVVTAEDPTNWLLTNHPDAYMAAALVWGGVFMKDDPEAVKWKAILDEAIEDIAWKEARSLAIAPLQVDSALLGRGNFNIYSG